MHDGGVQSATAAEVRGTATQGSVRALERLSEIARELGATRVADEAANAARRLAEERFFVACLGQFKRGKSTLINALVGQQVLPVAVAPVTSVVTILRSGLVPSAQLRLRDGRTVPIPIATLAEYVDERQNPRNRKGVAAVEVFLPSPVLHNGLCLVDTPGVGSVFTANTEVTRAFLPQIDAALVVLGADPPVSKAELDLVAEVAPSVRHVIVVLNKGDRVSAADLAEAQAFTEEVLAGASVRLDGAPLQVSAWERIEREQPTREWSALEQRLTALAAGSRAEILASAQTRTVARLSQQVVAELDERKAALVRPLSLTEARVGRLRGALAEANRSLVDLASLFSAAEARLGCAFEATREQFLAKARAATLAELDAWVSARAGDMPAGRLRTAAYGEARAVVRRVIEAWLTGIEPQAEGLYQEATARFVRLANAFLARIGSEAAAEGRAIERHPLRVEPGFHEPRRFYFANLMMLTAIGPRAWLSDRLSPVGWRARKVRDAARAYAGHLLHTNAMRVENDLKERVLESRRALERQVRECLTEAVGVAERALTEVQGRLAGGQADVQARLMELRRFEEEVARMTRTETGGAR